MALLSHFLDSLIRSYRYLARLLAILAPLGSTDAHLLVYAAMFQGSFRSAFSAAQEVAALSSDHMVKNWPDFFESYLPVPLHVLIRFGKFEEVLLLPFPEDPVLYCTTTASLHYARGIAHAALGDTSAARAEQSLFREARTKVAPSRMHFQVKADEIMAIAEEMLEGEILYREGKHEEAYARLRRGVELDDGLAYMEPWWVDRRQVGGCSTHFWSDCRGWMVPVRHALAALLLDQGHADRALPIYRADMAPTKHPDNIWSLRGLLECLEKLGKGAEKCPGETEEVRRKVAERAKDADVQVEVSCYCRR